MKYWPFIGLLLTSCQDPAHLGALPGTVQPPTYTATPIPATQAIWIVAAGQSNMVGAGMRNDPFPSDSYITMYNTATSLTGRIGPSYAWAMEYRTRHNNTQVNIIECAEGGSPITLWQPGARVFSQCVALWQSLGSPSIKGILYMQGEAEGMYGKMEDALSWGNMFVNTVQGFRSLWANVPIVFSQIGPNPGNPNYNGNGPSPDYLSWQEVQHQQENVNIANCYMVRSSDLTLSDGWVHFDKGSYQTIGQRMYQAYGG